MNVNELMIGDWVECFDSTHKEKLYVKVKAIEEDGGILVEKGNSNWFVDMEDTKPIPLTPEILEKNGFKWNEYHICLELVSGSLHLCWGFYENCLSASDWSENGDCQITSLKCEYVHQLQHALSLCGIEKEIIL